jgi:flagellum-specific peptidoglycan hydrolase FlgJ
VVLQHGEYTISYCHLSKVRVSEGDELIAGDVVAVSGNTGRSTGCHLHITCRYKGALADPYTLLLYIGDVRAEACTALLGEGVTADIDSISQYQRMDRKTFLSHYAPAAMEQQRQYGIPASVTLAQMAFESDWGRSDLARKGNNYFGIKCSPQWLAEGRPYSLHNDDKPDEKFCNYATVEESIDHHSRLLMSDRYKRCHSYSSTDYHHWLLALKAAGYATARDYVQLCEQIIRKYQLFRYDRLVQQ